ncbi:hypothetical protein Tco_1222207 [Tanacetum coccineum]
MAGDGVAGIKRRRRDLSSDGVRNLVTASGRGRLKEDLESSTWRRRQDCKATPSQSIERFLNNFANQPNETNMNDLESDDESVGTPLVSLFSHLDNDSDDGEVLNELIDYENVGMLRREKAINSFDGDDLGFQCSFTYITDFVVLEDIGEFILIDKAEVVMSKPFRKITKLEYDCAKGLMSFNRILDNYTFQMPRTIVRLYLTRRRLEVLSSLDDS